VTREKTFELARANTAHCARPVTMAAAVASWKAFVAATAAGADAYGPECAALREHGMTALAETHFVESVEVRVPSSVPT